MARRKATGPRETMTTAKKPNSKKPPLDRRRKLGTRMLEPKTSLDECTEKEKKFFYELIGDANFNVKVAYATAYGSSNDNSSRANGCRLYRRLLPIIRGWLDEAGLSEERLKIKLLELLEAKETKFFAHEGNVVTEKEVKAYSIQMEALKTAMKARGMLSEKSAREVDQIDRLIEIELEKLAVARQGSAPGKTAETDKPD